MKIGSFLDDQIEQNVTYSYNRRGMDLPYPPDDMEEAQKRDYYTKENGNLFFDMPVSWKNTVLIQDGVDIMFRLGEKAFVDHILLKQEYNSGLASVEIFTKIQGNIKKIGFYLPETGNMITAEDIYIPVGFYCDNVIIRLQGDCMPIGITTLDIWGAWDMENTIWPTPYRVDYQRETISLRNMKTIKASGKDELFAAEYLCEKVKEKFGYAPEISEEAGDIVIQIRERVKSQKDAFRLEITTDGCLLEASNRLGLLYAVDVMLQRICGDIIRCCSVEDEAFMGVRGIHFALPPKNQIAFLKNIIKYVWIPMRYNTVFLEIAGAMRYDNYPEISECWTNACERYEKGEWPKPLHYGFVGKDIWEKNEVRELCEYMSDYGLEVIPEVECFSHSQYILMAYPHLAEKTAVKNASGAIDLNVEDALPSKFYPASMCPLHSDYYSTVFGIMDEVLEVVKPARFVHIGHDELLDLGKCSKCSQVPKGDLFAEEVRTLNNYIKAKGLRTMMWSDMPQHKEYSAPTSINKIPKDIIMMDFIWYFYMDKDPEVNLLSHGFQIILGNMYSSHYPRFETRSHRKGILGAEVSTWVPCNELSYGFEGKIFDFVYSAEGMWNDCYRSDMRLTYNEIIKPILKDIRFRIGELHCDGVEKHIPIGGKRESIPYDIRDIVPYTGAVSAGVDCPMAEISVSGYAEIISFVHTTDKNSHRIMWKEPVKIGEYVICYEDGSEYIEELLYAVNIYKYLAPYGDRIASTLFRHEGYVGTYFTIPECGKTHNGNDYTLGKYSMKNPYPQKRITKITLKHCSNTDAKILLFDVMLAGQKRLGRKEPSLSGGAREDG